MQKGTNGLIYNESCKVINETNDMSQWKLRYFHYSKREKKWVTSYKK